MPASPLGSQSQSRSRVSGWSGSGGHGGGVYRYKEQAGGNSDSALAYPWHIGEEGVRGAARLAPITPGPVKED